MALKVVLEKMKSSGKIGEGETLHMFLGVDEYQKIKKVGGQLINKEENEQGLLLDLLDCLGDILSTPVDGIRLYPMLAGTDMSAFSIANSSKIETLRLPMLLLTPTQVETAVSSTIYGPYLLTLAPVRRDLFYLGGVPRWAFEYVSSLVRELEKNGKDATLSLDQIKSQFDQIVGIFVEKWGGSEEFKAGDVIKLAAYSVAGVPVDLKNAVVGDMSWSRIRDQSLCILTQDNEVEIPYSIFHRIGRFSLEGFSEVEACFVKCVKDMIDEVDSKFYTNAPWALWEVFGAYFHALRINAMIIIGNNSVKASELFLGAIVAGCEFEVELSPTKVFRTNEKFSEDIKKEVGRKGNEAEKVNWTEGGSVIINGDNGKGLDLFFALKKKNKDIVIFEDSRKRASGTDLGPDRIAGFLKSSSIMPLNLGNVEVVPMLFSSLVGTSITKDNIKIRNAVVVTYSQLQSYHKGLLLHPASSPCVNVNKDPATYLKMVLSGKRRDIEKVTCGLVSRKRSFESIPEFYDAVKRICKKVQLSKNKDRIVF